MYMLSCPFVHPFVCCPVIGSSVWELTFAFKFHMKILRSYYIQILCYFGFIFDMKIDNGPKFYLAPPQPMSLTYRSRVHTLHLPCHDIFPSLLILGHDSAKLSCSSIVDAKFCSVVFLLGCSIQKSFSISREVEWGDCPRIHWWFLYVDTTT